jgi:hypothetical protein
VSPALAQSAAPTDPTDESAEDHPLFRNFAPRILQGAKREAEREPVPATDMAAGVLQSGDLKSWPRLWRQGDWLVSGSLTGTLGLFKMGNNVFDPPPALNASNNKRDPGWGEFFLEPGLTFQYTPDAATKFYGGVAYMETATRGTDYGGVSNTYHGLPEQLYAGLHWQDTGRALTLDASYGQQDFTVANNLLISAGASNGKQRGSDYTGPRSAWANAGLLKATWHELAVQGFWLKPNDSTSATTGTRLAGINVDWGASGPVDLGFMYVRAPESEIVTRAGLDVYNVRAAVKSSAAALPRWSLKGEYVWERKSGVSASGWYLEGSYHAAHMTWQPLMMLRYASFSGDRPGSVTWEGFDPLYFGGSNPDWYQGKVMSTILNNTNLDSVAASLTLTPDAHSILQLVYLNFAVAQVNSPFDIPAAGMPVPVGGGLPAKALADELDAIYTYTFNKSVNVNLFAGYAWPGAGYQQLYAANGGSASGWWIIGTQFNISY